MNNISNINSLTLSYWLRCLLYIRRSFTFALPLLIFQQVYLNFIFIIIFCYNFYTYIFFLLFIRFISYSALTDSCVNHASTHTQHCTHPLADKFHASCNLTAGRGHLVSGRDVNKKSVNNCTQWVSRNTHTYIHTYVNINVCVRIYFQHSPTNDVNSL